MGEEPKIIPEEAHALAVKLAALTGESVEEAVTRSIEERLERERASRPTPRAQLSLEEMRARLDEILGDLHPLPPGPSREEIEAEIYDDWGLPR